jgi:hypothetical protein
MIGRLAPEPPETHGLEREKDRRIVGLKDTEALGLIRKGSRCQNRAPFFFLS